MDSPPGSSPAALTEAGSSTPARNSPIPNNITPSKSPLPPLRQTALLSAPSDQPTTTTATTTGPPPAVSNPTSTTTINKAKRRTAEELEKERAEKKQKKDERDAQLAAKAAEKAAEKAEKDKLKAEKEKIRQEKAALKAKVDAEKEAIRRKKEEEELVELRKKEKQRNLLASFIKTTPAPAVPSKTKPEAQASVTPSADGESSAAQRQPEHESEYSRRFRPFFVKSGVKLAPTPFKMDEPAKEAKSRNLDEFIQHKPAEFNPHPFNPVETFHLHGLPTKRGIMPTPVKEIMEQLNGEPSSSTLGTTPIKTESQNESLSTVQDKLNAIPTKYLCFYEDVRPPYIGTATTNMTRKTLRQLCVKPTRRTLQIVNYDYDSEAEWVEDEGEDLEDLDDDEEDQEGEEEMDDFLDDSEDPLAANRPAFLGELQPTSSGICFENRKRLGPSPTLYKYKLEFLLGTSSPVLPCQNLIINLTNFIDTLEHHNGIDPFSSAYWEPKTTIPAEGKTAATSTTAAGAMAPPPTKDAFSRLTAGSGAGHAPSAAADGKDLVPAEVLEEFKQAVVSEQICEHTKSTVIDLLAKQFASCTKAQIKTTLDKVAQRASVPGEKKSVKRWQLLPLSSAS